MDAERQLIVGAYRSLYRAGLHAVQYSKPARYVLKRTLDNEFRNNSASKFNKHRVGNTLMFLENAAKTRGVEHRILKNLIHVRWLEHTKDKTPHRGYESFLFTWYSVLSSDTVL